MSPNWIVQTLFLVFRSYTETPAPGYDSMYDLALRGYDALHAVHGEYYEVGCIPCVLYTAAGTSLDWALGVAHIPYVYRYIPYIHMHIPYMYKCVFDEVNLSHNWIILFTCLCVEMNHIAS